MGEFLAVIAGMCFSLSAVLSQRGMRKANASTGVLINLIMNNILFAVFTIVIFKKYGLPNLNLEGILFAMGGGVAGNVVGRTLNYIAIRRIGSPRAILLSLTQTLFAFIFGLFLLGEIINYISLIGVALVVLGVYLLSIEKVRKSEETKSKKTEENTKGKVINKAILFGIISALMAGFAYSAADLLRKLSLKAMPSAVTASFIGGLSALLIQSLIYTFHGGWRDLAKLDRNSLLNLFAAGTAGGFAIISLNTALSFTPVVIVNALYNTRVWFAIAMSPFLLGDEGRITRMIIISTIFILAGTLMIISA